ncbi:glycosyltransferase [Holdemania massiliensis]|uniref:glycosyltransferase n=1 Tax=Holdemania massiliensis TaxID=1468449 RepID=UPI00352085F6
MKIVQINSVYQFGSTGKIVSNLHDYCLAHDIDSYVFYARKNPKEKKQKKNVYYFSDPIGLTNHVIQGVLFDKHGLYSKKNTQSMIQKLCEIDPDIIHLHNIHGFYCNYPMLFTFLKQRGKPVIWTLHDCWSFTGYCACYDYHHCYKWKSGCKCCPYFDNYPYRILSNSKNNFKLKQKTYESLPITLVVPSQWLKDEVSKSMLSEYPCKIINNSVDLSHFYYEPNSLRHNYHLENLKVYLAVSSYWTKQKGFLEYRKLAEMLNPNERLVMIGLNEKQKRNLPNSILGIGRLNQDELRKWYSIADVFVNLTLEDNYPTVNLEARACGTPILTYNVGGSTEMVVNYGKIIEPYKIDEVLKTLRETSWTRANNNIVDQNMTNEYYNLYTSLI